MCIFHLIYTVRPCLIHTCHAASMSCSDHAVLLKVTAQHGRPSTAMLCCSLEKNGMIRAWHESGMASVNQTRPHYVNQMEQTHSKPIAARHGRGTAWALHTMCESAFIRSWTYNVLWKVGTDNDLCTYAKFGFHTAHFCDAHIYCTAFWTPPVNIM